MFVVCCDLRRLIPQVYALLAIITRWRFAAAQLVEERRINEQFADMHGAEISKILQSKNQDLIEKLGDSVSGVDPFRSLSDEALGTGGHRARDEPMMPLEVRC